MKTLKSLVFKLIILLVFVIAVLVAADNSSPVALRFLDMSSWEWPIAWWVLVAFVIGLLVGWLTSGWANMKLRMATRRANKEVVKSKEALDEARAELVYEAPGKTE